LVKNMVFRFFGALFVVGWLCRMYFICKIH
jgi:hypothetical protein